VADTNTNKALRLEVQLSHRLGEVIETVVNALGLPRDRAYSIVKDRLELGPESYEASLQQLGINEGDQLDLVVRPIGG